MRRQVMDFLRRVIDPKEVAGKRVLEVGSFNVNGSPREVLEPLRPCMYLGVDLCCGPGVDIRCDAESLPTFVCHAFDLVISTETLEHIRDWRKAVNSMKLMVEPGGILIVTAAAPGYPRHEHPNDFWRFSKHDFKAIFSDYHILEFEEISPPGVLMKARKSTSFQLLDLSGIIPEKAPAR
jgi:SAM-dependent methyltransferase